MLIDQIPRNSQLWLFFALIWALAPHLGHLPIWVLLAGAVIFVWRWRIYLGRWAMPGAIIKTLLVVVCAFGIWRGYGSWRGVEPMTGLLLVGMLLKLLEMKTRRDALLVVFLGYFAAGAQLLFSQMILETVYSLVSVWLLLTAQQLLFSGTQGAVKRALKHSGGLLLQAVPLMLVLFMILPRTGPLWAMPMQKHAAKTGISDSLSPGDVVNLTKSGKLAFRVDFDGDLPPPAERYWRGLVMSKFDGRTWRARPYEFNPGGRAFDVFNQSPSPWRVARGDIRPGERVFDYRILMEPSHQRWLFTLGLPLAIESTKRWAITVDQTVQALTPLSERSRFSLTAVDRPVGDGELHPFMRRHYLALPEGFNPRTQALAEQWRSEGLAPAAMIQRFLELVQSRFVYTLQPPALGEHSVDDFLFQTQQGFCEHFASSFVVFARAAGIPARVVTGYQGGELGLAGDYLLVHQMDAHAWAEVWITDHWQRVDPTAAVAPSRIRDGLRAAMQDSVDLLGEPLSLMRYSHINWLNQARLQWEEINYRWQNSVVGFDTERQSSLLKNLLGGLEPWRVGVFFLVGAVGPVLLIALWFAWRNRPQPQPKLHKMLQQFERKAGVTRQPGEAVGDYFTRVALRYPTHSNQVQRLARLFEQGLYGAQEAEVSALLKTQIRLFKAPKADA